MRDICKAHLPGSFAELLRKIHASGFSTSCMSQDPSQDQNVRISVQEPCLWSLDRVLVQEPSFRISKGSMTAGPLQGPCPRALCKIYVSRSSRRSMPPDPWLLSICESSTRCISRHLCLSILTCGPSARCVSQDTSAAQDDLQDPCLRIHRCFRMHVSASVSLGPYTRSMPQDPLRDPCFQTHVSESMPQQPELWILYKSHVPRSSRRSMPPDPWLRLHMCESSTRCKSVDLCLSILICGTSARSMSQDTLQDPWLRIICKIHVSGSSIEKRCFGSVYKIYASGSAARSMFPDPCLRTYASAA